jgi:cytochrome c553
MMRMPKKLVWLICLLVPIMATSAHAAKLAPRSLTLVPGESATIKVSSVKGTPALGNTDTAVATASLSGDTITVTANAIGSTILSVQDSSSRAATVKVTVQPPMSLSEDSVSVEIKKSARITISNAAGKVRLTNSDAGKMQASLRSNSITITGKEAGTSTLTVSDGKTTQTLTVEVKSSRRTTTSTVSGNTNGRLLASNCFQCHGTYGSGGFESLRGKSDLADELNEFLSGEEDSDGIMAAHMKGYTTEQLQAIATYLANP